MQSVCGDMMRMISDVMIDDVSDGANGMIPGRTALPSCMPSCHAASVRLACVPIVAGTMA